ncbi:LamG-like jellyroll fold domain-containing protein [Micromonospora sp. NPDC049836]|uniref:LamG-like jellyroll fold domain-containing protein n=1 Tax=Micromonospora sp. NPDC049836 TaxID=3364274 RepID=UPI0037AB28AD
MGAVADDSAASRMAQACDRTVEVSSRTSETNLTVANPDGSFTMRSTPVPVRARTPKGWAAIDVSLQRTADGGIAPKVTTVPLRLSGGGSGPLVSVGEPGARFSLTWPAALPTPVLTGDTATYPEVLPGVDLAVTAEPTGFRQLLVVKSREAATNPALRRVTLGLAADGAQVRTSAGNGVEVVDRAGKPLFVSPGAHMWDSPAPIPSIAARPAAERARLLADQAASTGGEPTPHRLVRMPVQVSKDSLTVLPDTKMLAAPDTIFPVYIDPPFSKPSPTHWTNVMNHNPNHSYYGESSDMRVGRQWQTSDVWRSHMQFNIAEMSGAQVLSASLHITADHTADCATTSIELWQTQLFNTPSTYTWYNDSDGDWMSRVDTDTFSANESTCPKGDDPGEFTGSLRSKLQTQATNKATRMAFGLRATKESDQYDWTRFHASSVSLQATYNRTPGTPTGMAVTDCFSSCTSSPVVGRRDPELSVFATDPDSGTVLTVYFDVQTAAGVTVATGVKTGYASGPSTPAQPAKWRVTPTLADGAYRWRSRSKDEQGAYSPYTAWATFRTSTTAPAPPVIYSSSSSLYFEDDGSGRSSGEIGRRGFITARTPQDYNNPIDDILCSLDGSPWQSAYTQSNRGVIVDGVMQLWWGGQCEVVPRTDLLRTLTVKFIAANGMSSTGTYQFRVTSPPPEAGHWTFDGHYDDDETLLENPHDLTEQDTAPTFVQRRWTDQPYPEGYQEASFNGTAYLRSFEVPVATGPLSSTGVRRSFAVAAWVRPTDLTANRTAISQSGDNHSMYELGYRKGSGYCFSMYAADTTTTGGTHVCAPAPVIAGEWAHVAAVYDGTAGTMTLYVHRKGADGFIDDSRTEIATGTFTSVWDGAHVFGVGAIQGPDEFSVNSYFIGDIDEVWAYQRAPELSEIEFLAAN